MHEHIRMADMQGGILLQRCTIQNDQDYERGCNDASMSTLHKRFRLQARLAESVARITVPQRYMSHFDL